MPLGITARQSRIGDRGNWQRGSVVPVIGNAPVRHEKRRRALSMG